tara:strand:+ start:6305 stop:7165 length:861 start_codon:yes stop_codon:yes gene_type:complete
MNCSEKDTPVTTPTGNEKLSFKIDDQYYVSSRDESVIYYEQSLFIDSDSLIPLEDGDIWFDFRFIGQTDGSINQEFASSGYFYLEEYSTKHGVRTLYPVAGQQQGFFTKFDTITGSISGTFGGLLETDDKSETFQISNGVFNDLKITKLYCEPEYPLYQHDSTSLYNKWALVGIRNKNGNFDYPPCNSIPTLTIYPESDDPTFENFKGNDSSNSFIGNAEINEIEQTITIGELRSTLALVSWWNSAFDAKFMDFLYEETVSYQYSSTELIFTKENSDKELVFVAIE